MSAATSPQSLKPAASLPRKWYQSRAWVTVLGLAKLGLTVLFASLAIDSGSLWQWLVAFIFLFGVIGDLIQVVRYKRS